MTTETTGTLLPIIEHGNRRIDTACAEVAKTDEYMDLMRAYGEYHGELKTALAPEQLDLLAEMEVLQEQCAELCYHATYLVGIADGFALRRAVVG